MDKLRRQESRWRTRHVTQTFAIGLISHRKCLMNGPRAPKPVVYPLSFSPLSRFVFFFSLSFLLWWWLLLSNAVLRALSDRETESYVSEIIGWLRILLDPCVVQFCTFAQKEVLRSFIVHCEWNESSEFWELIIFFIIYEVLFGDVAFDNIFRCDD